MEEGRRKATGRTSSSEERELVCQSPRRSLVRDTNRQGSHHRASAREARDHGISVGVRVDVLELRRTRQVRHHEGHGVRLVGDAIVAHRVVPPGERAGTGVDGAGVAGVAPGVDVVDAGVGRVERPQRGEAGRRAELALEHDALRAVGDAGPVRGRGERQLGRRAVRRAGGRGGRTRGARRGRSGRGAG